MASKTKAGAHHRPGRTPRGAKAQPVNGKCTTAIERLRARKPSRTTKHGIAPDPALAATDGERAYALTTYPNRYRTDKGHTHDLSWRQILAVVAAPEPIPGTKDDLPFWHGSRLKPGGRRCNADVEAVSVLFLDIDERLDDAIDGIRGRGFLAVAFPSPSGREDRGRILIPLARDVTPDEFRVLWSIVNGWTGGLVDPQTRSPSHGFYTPAIPDREAWWVEELEGELLDPDRFDLSADSDTAPVLRAPTTQELEVFDLGFRRRQAEEAMGHIPEASEGNRHGSLFRAAQICRDYGLPLELTEELVLEWNEDRCRPPKDPDVVRRNVLAGLDRYRRNPVGCAVTLCVRSSRNHTETLDRILAILAERCEGLYTRQGSLIEIVDGGRLEPVSVKRLNELITRHVKLYTFKAATRNTPAGWVRADVPKWVSEELDARPSYPQLREIEGIANAATLRPDGSVLCEPGYDRATRLVFTGEPVDVPEKPTKEEGAAALERVEALFAQFPLDPAGRAAHMSLMLTAVARAFLRGPVPVGLFDANIKQSGKSILAQSIAVVMLGHRAAKVDWIALDEKMADRLHACAVTDGRVILFDNLRNASVVESPMLDGALTSMIVSRPKKYAHVNLDCVFKPIVLITGNGLKIGGDLAPRCLYVRLVSKLERPEERDDLEIPDLLGHIERNRQGVIVDLLTAWRAWITAGKPGDVSAWHTFAAWAPVRKLLAWYGRPDPGETRNDARENDDEEEYGKLIYGYIAEHWPDEGASATEIADRLRPRRAFAGGEPGGVDTDASTIWSWLRSHEKNRSGTEPDGRLLGVALRVYKDRPYDGRVLRFERPRIDGKKRPRWVVRPLDPT